MIILALVVDKLDQDRAYCYHSDSMEVIVGQILVRNLDDAVIERLKAKAAADNASLEQTVRNLLTAAARESDEYIWAEIEQAVAELPGRSLDPTDLIREDRDRR